MTNHSYRPDIDGLRAIAILLVVIYHAFPTLLPSGFIGVDIFFVISGYLITSNILKNLHEQKFSILDFYARRFRRIVPALITVLITTLLLGYVYLRQYDFERLGAHTIAGAGFFSNLLLIKESGYFDISPERKPLLHLWSLGVEEQYYFFWPLILAGVVKTFQKPVIALIFLFICSFTANLYGTNHFTQISFYLLPMRFWELLAGCLLAFRPNHLQIFRKINLFAIPLLIFGLIGINSSSAFPGFWALIPVSISVILIGAGPMGILNKNILSSKPLVWIGLISYPLYLWHWPLLSISKIGINIPIFLSPLLILLFSFLLAWLTYYFLEKPFRSSRFFKKPAYVISLAMLALTMISTVSLPIWKAKLLSYDKHTYPDAYLLQKYANHDFESNRFRKCFIESTLPFRGFAPECTKLSSSHTRRVLLIGDSEGAHLYPGLKAAYQAQNSNVDLLQLTASSCSISVTYNANTATCNRVREEIIKAIDEIKPDLLILHEDWTSHLITLSDWRDLKLTLEQFHKLGARKILIFGPTPQWSTPLPQILEHEFVRKNLEIPNRIDIDLNTKIFGVNKELEEKSKAWKFNYANALNELCNEQGCLTQVGANPFTDLIKYDSQHLTEKGASYLIQTFEKEL